MTQTEIAGVVRLLARLWPQMADLADNDELLDVWRRSLGPLDAEAVIEALKRHRAAQVKPIRPEPGEIRAMVRRYGTGASDAIEARSDLVGLDIFVQAVEVAPEAPVPDRAVKVVGRFHQLVFIRSDQAAPTRAGLLDQAAAWCRRLRGRTGCVWAVVEGMTECDMSRRRFELRARGIGRKTPLMREVTACVT